MELLLINHPLDCPVCDKGGECPLQNQAMSNGRADSRFLEKKRTFPKPIAISSNVLLDRERCVLCQRCTRFSEQIAGDPFIDLLERGAEQQIGTSEEQPFQSYFSGNTVQICPVGALTGASYRFRARPFDLRSTDSVCEHCSSGCALRVDWRRSKVTRRLAGDEPEVNEEWNCDKGRWAFHYAEQSDRLLVPMVRDKSGRLVETSWPDALEAAADGLRAADRARRRAARRTADRGGRLRLLEVRPPRARHERHRLPGPSALGGGDGVPRHARGRRDTAARVVQVAGERAGSAARRLRARGRIADRLPAAAQGRAHARGQDRGGRTFHVRRRPQARRPARAGTARRRGDRSVVARHRGDHCALAGRRGHPRRRAAGHARRARCRRRPNSPRPPVPHWPGSRAAPARSAPSPPVPCRCPSPDGESTSPVATPTRSSRPSSRR